MLDVAETVFAERGYLAASMDEIAERVGVSKPMLYEYYGSKEGLLIGCIHRARTELLERTQQAIAGADAPEEVLRRGLLAFFEFIAGHKQSWSLLRHEAAITVPSAVEEVEGIRRQQTDLIAAVLLAFAPDVDAVEAEAFAEIVVGSTERLALWCERRPDVGPERATRYVMDVVWRGVAARLG
ncbi:helix-turn-helix domain-containing protein [Saccharothrix longispora]|uniref:TetR/AcrR family transcriptional regulator n=1 Tax=Saccharothrix longispora TaxID=33920 RepID=UPI0028FD7E0F|nr:helix-turn-helix domain-containing protein [Saccharothrix longispora]MBY8848638.1 TetR/AcrR family transcriptional regulator [Saccharothrix sp. MB29]MDU0289851.1 helix-turn-helix domain-containing protein [Saccharothrix longispora]